jgi:hypothetical protein
MALILACGALASNAPALVYMTDENGNSIGSSHYSITYVGGNTYNVIIKSHHRSGGANSYFVIHGSGGENIGTISVQAPSDGYSTNYVVIRVLSDDGTSGIFDLDSVYQTTGGTEGAVLISWISKVPWAPSALIPSAISSPWGVSMARSSLPANTGMGVSQRSAAPERARLSWEM